MDSRPHLKRQDSRFTTCFPEPELSGFSRASRVGVIAVDNEVIDTGDGGPLLVVDHQNFIELVMAPEMNLMASGTHKFRSFTPVDTSRVWIALTDGQATGRYLHGLVADSSWCADAPIHFRAAPLQSASQSMLAGRVLCALPCRRLSYFLRSGPEDPCTYLTWQLRSCPGGSTVHLHVDQAECADTEEEAENTWLPVLAALQTLLSRGERHDLRYPTCQRARILRSIPYRREGGRPQLP